MAAPYGYGARPDRDVVIHFSESCYSTSVQRSGRFTKLSYDQQIVDFDHLKPEDDKKSRPPRFRFSSSFFGAKKVFSCFRSSLDPLGILFSSSGERKGKRVLELQTALRAWKMCGRSKSQVQEEIVELFEGLESYQELCDIRESIDAGVTGSSRFHELVYSDLNVANCHRVIIAINEKVRSAYQENPDQIAFAYMIYSDIDDTIRPSLNDKNSGVKGFYPSAIEFYRALGEALSPEGFPNVRLTFLSARLNEGRSCWSRGLKRILPEDLSFFALYGRAKPFAKGIQHYSWGKITGAFAKKLPKGEIQSAIQRYVDGKASDTLTSFALDKRRNIDRNLLLFPEVRPIMIGDSGEGDLIFLLSKNMGLRSPINDKRIPEVYKGDNWGDRPLDGPGNPTDKPLFKGFVHLISSPFTYRVSPDPTRWRDEFERETNTHVLDNYVDGVLIALKEGMLTVKAADKVVQASRDWLEAEAASETLSAKELYKQKLVQSIEKYEAFKFHNKNPR